MEQTFGISPLRHFFEFNDTICAIIMTLLSTRLESRYSMSIPHDDYDSPWKQMLELYFEEFMLFFFPEAHVQINWQRSIQFLDKELQQVVRDGELGRRYADVLVQVWLLDGSQQWVLIHVEIQGQPEPNFDKRMYTYNYRLFDAYDHDVASFAVLSDTNNSWRPSRYYVELLGSKLLFEYATAKLLDYQSQWESLEVSNSVFATVVMAHLKTQETKDDASARYDWKFYLVRRLLESGYSRQEVVNLFHFIDWLMQLPKELEQQLREEIVQMEMRTSKPYVSTIERLAQEEGREEGREEGLHQAAQRILLHLLTHRFGEVSEQIHQRLNKLSAKQLEDLVDAVLTASSLDTFVQKLPKE